jgi:MFS family permease
MAVVTLGEMVMVPVSAAYVADLAPAHMRGRYMGVHGLVWAAALIIGPTLGMKLLALGPAVLWLSCGVLGLVATAIMLSDVKTRVAAPVTPGEDQAEAILGRNLER